MYDHRILTVFDFDPEITETMDRGAAVGALQKIMYDRCAFCDGTKHNTAVGNGFVSRNGYFTF